jgi:diguanylate cyclase (GGDEF)-like protein
MDATTIFIIAALMMLLNGGVLGLIHATLSPDVQPSAADWRIGTLLAAGACLLLAFQRHLPAGFILPIANGCSMAAMVLYARSLRRFQRLPDRWWLWLIVPACMAGVYWYAAVAPSLAGRIVVVSLSWVLPIAMSISVLLRPDRGGALVSGRVLAAIFVVVFFFMLWRGIYFAFWPTAEQNMLDNPGVASLVAPLLLSMLPIIGTTAFALMCTERVQRQWKTVASVDHLTGIANRMALSRDADLRFAAARKRKGGLAVLAIDIDHFKSINDRFGHGIGDRALVHIAATLQHVCQKPHIVGRHGGEEFVAVLAVPDEAKALAMGEQVRHAVESSALPMRDADALTMTISVGVAFAHERDQSVDDLLRRADRALYAAKEAGRNRVVVDRD